MKSITSRPKIWGGLVVSSFVEIEVVSAIAKAARSIPVFQQAEALRTVGRTVGTFLSDYRSGAFSTVALTPEILYAAIDELRTSPKDEIGAGDAIHLATALAFVQVNPDDPLVFATADRGLYHAAKQRGLRVYDPNYESSDRLADYLRA
ncbi:MAG TPA: type II toxin-antitoxin system VapC family toxin [Longimicrobium sp.]|nr:type II toxin-antitoxin system VapC family toxin [Longimicrobium sp.]